MDSIERFEQFGLDPSLLEGIQAMGYTRPTPIQVETIPAAMTGGDIIGASQTGTGKTAAFLLPILHRLITKPGAGTRALILTPTRELAAQIEEHRQTLGGTSGISGVAVFGGVGMEPQVQALRSGVQIVTATPGRLLDHMERRNVRLDRVEVLVLDEADRMLDMGFLPDVRRILAALPRERQTMLFSATIPPEIADLARDVLRAPRTIQIGRRAAPAAGITHAAYPVPQHLKTTLLLRLLRGEGMTSVLVFTRTKHRADRVARGLSREGFAVERLHSNRSQAQRTAALASFRAGRIQILVATDLASRGLDVELISHVINYDIPATPDQYVHRIGRTARAEAVGDAFTLFSPEEGRELVAIEKAIGRALPRVTLPDFDYRAARPLRPEPGRAPARHGPPTHRPGAPAKPGGRRRRRRGGAVAAVPAVGKPTAAAEAPTRAATEAAAPPPQGRAPSRKRREGRRRRPRRERYGNVTIGPAPTSKPPAWARRGR